MNEIAPAGFYLALRVGYAFPEAELNRLNDDWVDMYTQQGLVVQDPSMHWIYHNVGYVRWSDLKDDPRGVVEMARQMGLLFGATISYNTSSDAGRRSHAVLFRSDRDFTDAELHEAFQMLKTLHVDASQRSLTDAELEAIRYRADGLLIKQIAAKLAISESGVKARLSSASRKLGARNAIEMLAIATSRRLI
ncbi:LuxR family transcriptional regulator [Thioclava sp. ES.031]|uniref:helix-turn-helix transcriptional regulator n=1 Tax=Thioclava sp. ES.031 TaxID=1798203 RepID=UPI001596D6E3|nr:LuxR family transcriptional regulator [Thioclava sp. ES.031]